MRASHRGFTLIELLVVIAIVAVLAVTVVITLNPAQLLAQARDTTRLSDLRTINSALSVLQAGNSNVGLGSSSTIYVSVPDSSSTCANLGLPALPSGYTYGCVTAANLTNVNGSGWIPVNFTGMDSGSPLSRLPLDPINSVATNQYYTYFPGGSWKLTGQMESEKFARAARDDGGIDPAIVEYGTSLSIGGFQRGLVGYFPLDEGTGLTTADATGRGNTATLSNGASWLGEGACKIGDCLSFDGIDDYVRQALTGVTFNDQVTIMAWVNLQTGGNNNMLFSLTGSPSMYHTLSGASCPSARSFGYVTYFGSAPAYPNAPSAPLTACGTWHHIAFTYNESVLRSYRNGELIGETAETRPYIYNAGYVTLGGHWGLTSFNKVFIDDARVYNRALPPAEIKQIYRAMR